MADVNMDFNAEQKTSSDLNFRAEIRVSFNAQQESGSNLAYRVAHFV